VKESVPFEAERGRGIIVRHYVGRRCVDRLHVGIVVVQDRDRQGVVDRVVDCVADRCRVVRRRGKVIRIIEGAVWLTSVDRVRDRVASRFRSESATASITSPDIRKRSSIFFAMPASSALEPGEQLLGECLVLRRSPSSLA
jgi:hypothetical protein